MTLKERQEQMLAMVRQWEASGQSATQFIAENNINKSTFYYWVGKHKKKKNTKLQDNFVQLYPETSPTEMVVRYPNGVEVFLPVNTSAQTLKRLIRL